MFFFFFFFAWAATGSDRATRPMTPAVRTILRKEGIAELGEQSVRVWSCASA